MRGNCRTSGEQRRKESGNVFGEGSRTPIAITILVRKGEADFSRPLRPVRPTCPAKPPARIYYRDIGDYLTREDKLKTIQDLGSILSDKMELASIEPNEAGDWINQRDGLFDTFIPLGDKDDKTARTVFVPYYSRGCASARDAWVYNYSRQALERNIASMIGFYNSNIDTLLSARKEAPECNRSFNSIRPRSAGQEACEMTLKSVGNTRFSQNVSERRFIAPS